MSSQQESGMHRNIIVIREYSGDLAGAQIEHTKQWVELSDVSNLSIPFRENTKVITMFSRIYCWVDVGIDPKATATSAPLMPDHETVLAVSPGMRVSVVTFAVDVAAK